MAGEDPEPETPEAAATQAATNGVTNVDAVELRADGGAVVIIDQTLLPNRLEYLELADAKDMYDAIFQLKVRGAPAIGVCAGYCYYVLARQEAARGAGYDEFASAMERQRAYLNSSRPTAVNLSWALSRMHGVTLAHRGEDPSGLAALFE